MSGLVLTVDLQFWLAAVTWVAVAVWLVVVGLLVARALFGSGPRPPLGGAA